MNDVKLIKQLSYRRLDKFRNEVEVPMKKIINERAEKMVSVLKENQLFEEFLEFNNEMLGYAVSIFLSGRRPYDDPLSIKIQKLLSFSEIEFDDISSDYSMFYIEDYVFVPAMYNLPYYRSNKKTYVIVFDGSKVTANTLKQWLNFNVAYIYSIQIHNSIWYNVALRGKETEVEQLLINKKKFVVSVLRPQDDDIEKAHKFVSGYFDRPTYKEGTFTEPWLDRRDLRYTRDFIDHIDPLADEKARFLSNRERLLNSNVKLPPEVCMSYSYDKFLARCIALY